MMTRKIYVAVAQILRRHLADPDMVNDFADMFEGDNPAFDRDRFHDAAIDPDPGIKRDIRALRDGRA